MKEEKNFNFYLFFLFGVRMRIHVEKSWDQEQDPDNNNRCGSETLLPTDSSLLGNYSIGYDL